MGRKKICIEFDKLVEAVSSQTPHCDRYINTETGGIAIFSEFSDSFDEDGKQISSWDTDRFKDAKYLELPCLESRETYEEMENFAASLKDPALKRQLQLALEKRRPFRRFNEILENHTGHCQKFNKHINNKYREVVLLWLGKHNLETSEGRHGDEDVKMVNGFEVADEIELTDEAIKWKSEGAKEKSMEIAKKMKAANEPDNKIYNYTGVNLTMLEDD